jgi:hypothetical protein
MANEWDCDATHWAAMSCDAAAAPAVCQGAGWRLRGGAARNPTRKVRGGAHVGVLLETLLVTVACSTRKVALSPSSGRKTLTRTLQVKNITHVP